MKVNVLGVEYKILEDDGRLNRLNADGVCKSYDKTIMIRKVEDYFCEDDTLASKQIRRKEVLRHELLHAFLDEAGLPEYGMDEKLVDWISIQFPKMAKAFEETGCL